MSLKEKFGERYKLNEVAEYLKCSTEKLYKLVKRGDGIGHKIQGCWYFTEEDIMRLIDHNKPKKELKKSTKKDINRIINKSKSIT